MITPMLVQAYGAAFAIIVGSVVLGRAICVLCGGPRRWACAPAVGLAAMIVITAASIRLPGRAVTAAVVLVLAVLVAAVYLWRRGKPRFALGDLVVGGVALLGASIPFVANGRVEMLGPPWDNDMAVHLLIAEALRNPAIAKLYPIPAGYPLGPHSLVATVGTATGLPLDMVFTGLLLATVCLTALVAADVLAAAALWRRVLVGVLCSLAYLVAAYYAEGAFKQTIVAALVLAFVLHLEQVRRRWWEGRPARRFGLLIPAGLLVAGSLYTFSYFGVSWFLATLGLWLVFELAARPALARRWVAPAGLRAAAPWVGGLIALGILVLIPIAGQLRTAYQLIGGVSPASVVSFAPHDLGNLPGPLSPYEALSVWGSQNFGVIGTTFRAGEGAALAVAALAFGFVWSVRRREFLFPAAAVGSWLIYLYVNHTQSPYVAAMALVIPAPVYLAMGLRALLTPGQGDRWAAAGLLGSAVVYCGLVAYSSYRTLQSEPVYTPEPAVELTAFHHTIGDAPTLFLGIDDFAAWELRDAPVDAPASSISVSTGGVVAQPSKPWNGLALDFDSISPTDLDRFAYVITTNTPYASQAPANFQLVARRRLYDLWKRTGRTPPFQVIEPPGAPGAILDCHTAPGRSLRASRGVAAVMTTPVLAPGVSLSAGQSASTSIALPAGRWELSAEYLSYFSLDFSAAGRQWTMPAYLGRNGPWFAVGEIAGRGVHSPVTVKIIAQRPSPLTGGLVTAVSVYQLAATRVPDTRRLLPLRNACGKYVDWYRLS